MMRVLDNKENVENKIFHLGSSPARCLKSLRVPFHSSLYDFRKNDGLIFKSEIRIMVPRTCNWQAT
jgi:hypothetical protein